MNIATVVLYTFADNDRLFVKQADEAVLISGSTGSETYLNADKIMEWARRTGANAIHPGYGFLSENVEFAQKCIDNRIIWIGPSPRSMQLLSNKISASEFASSLGLPVIPSAKGNIAGLLETAPTIGYPLVIKAAAGGGGRGMKIAHSPGELADLLEAASREAKQYFADERLFIAKYFNSARHVEVQVAGDNYGNALHFYERECSIQRRFQKIIEEAPAASLSEGLKNNLYADALKLIAAAKYNNVGTVEFLIDNAGKHYFLEMNTRIQVEHAVSEAITGIDLIQLQIEIAEGKKLNLEQSAIFATGHAIECRICAEDFENHLAPSAGFVSLHKIPQLPAIRIDTDIITGSEINTMFDSLLSKLIVHANSRNEARLLALESLGGYAIHGIKNNIPLLIEVLKNNDFVENEIHTGLLESEWSEFLKNIATQKAGITTNELVIAALLVWLQGKPNALIGKENVWQQMGYWRHLQVLQLRVQDSLMQAEIQLLPDNMVQFFINNGYYKVEWHLVRQNTIEFLYNSQRYVFQFSFQKNGGIVLSKHGYNHFIEIDHLCAGLPEPIINEPSYQANGFVEKFLAPIPGKLVKIAVAPGDEVPKGAVLAIIESMKTENRLLATANAKIEQVHIEEGQQIKARQLLFSLGPLT